MEITRQISEYNHSPRLGRSIKGIVIHYTGNYTDTASANARFFAGGDKGASAHYFVDETSIYQSVEEDQAAWAVGRKYGDAPLWGTLTNLNTISVEMCSSGGRIADATMRRTADLVRELVERYQVPADRVVRHWDVCGKRCPGWDGWLPPNESQWQRLREMIFSEEDDMSAQEVWDYKVGYDGQPGEKDAEAWKRLGWINANVDEIKAYLMQHSDPAKDGYDGDIYTRIAYMDQRIREISANNSALTEAVKTLAAAQGADPEKIAQMLADAVKAKLDSLQITMSAKTGQ